MARHPFFAPLVGTTLVLFALCARDAVASGWPWLAYNLALAWVPLLIGAVASRHRGLLLVLGPAWLLFLPNAPYLLTDLVHLRPHRGVPIWFDATLLGGTGALGLGIGVVSLRQVASAVLLWFGRPACLALYVAAPLLSGFGMYLGRFLRWNSWDLALRPRAVLWDALAPFVEPQAHLDAWAVTLTFGGAFLAAAAFAPPLRPTLTPTPAAGEDGTSVWARYLPGGGSA